MAKDKILGEWDWTFSTIIFPAATIYRDPQATVPPAPTRITFYDNGTFKNNSQCAFDNIDPSTEGTYQLLGITTSNLGHLVMSTEDSRINDTFWIELSDIGMVLTENQKIEMVQGKVTAVHEFRKR